MAGGMADAEIVSGVIALTKDRAKVLLVKRTIPPVGKWTLPAGFMEIGETSSAGAKREAMEEANAHLEIGPILSVYNILAAAQVQILYLAYLVDERVSAGSETSEAKLFSWDALPWDELAFSTVTHKFSVTPIFSTQTLLFLSCLTKVFFPPPPNPFIDNSKLF